MLILTSTLAVALLVAADQTTTAPRPKGGTLEIRVTDRTGEVLSGATVTADGPVPRDGKTNDEGALSLRNLVGGTYRLRFDREGFVSLEKEVTVKAGAPLTVHAALSAAPPPPAPPKPAEPPPPPPPPAPKLTAGAPVVLSIPDFADKQLIKNNEPAKETPIGCSGATSTRLLQAARAAITAHTHADADEVLYLVAGDATLMLGGKEHRLSSGSLALVPRGMEHTITRRSGGPIILISTVSGQPCS